MQPMKQAWQPAQPASYQHAPHVVPAATWMGKIKQDVDSKINPTISFTQPAQPTKSHHAPHVVPAAAWMGKIKQDSDSQINKVQELANTEWGFATPDQSDAQLFAPMPSNPATKWRAKIKQDADSKINPTIKSMQDSTDEKKKTRTRMTRLVIVRHGETDWNHEGRIQGQTDMPLNDVGLAQASTLAQVLHNRGICQRADAIVTSNLKRARQSADVIHNLCPEAPLVEDPDVGEINFGELQGKLFREEADGMNGVYDAWRSGDLERSFPGVDQRGEKGESIQSVIDRGQQALHKAAQLGSLVIVVSHLNFLKWTAVGVEAGRGPQLEGVPWSSVNKSEAMQGSNVKAVSELQMAQIPNCCCSNVMYDHETKSFLPEVWFEPLSNPITPGSQGQKDSIAEIAMQRLARSTSLEVPTDTKANVTVA